MANIRDLMTVEDAMDLEHLLEEAILDYNDYTEELNEDFRRAEHSAIFDWEIDLPSDYFF